MVLGIQGGCSSIVVPWDARPRRKRTGAYMCSCGRSCVRMKECSCMGVCFVSRVPPKTYQPTLVNTKIHNNTNTNTHISPSTHTMKQHGPAIAPPSATHNRPCSQSLADALHAIIARTIQLKNCSSPDWREWCR